MSGRQAEAHGASDVSVAGLVRTVPLPPAARSACTLPRLDYHDCFLAEVPAVRSRTAEQWARALVEEAPLRVRAGLLLGWSSLGLRLGWVGASDRVLGWEIRRSSPELAVLAGDSMLGIRAELLFSRREDGLLFATLLQLETALARGVWARVVPGHQRVVEGLLARLAQGA